MEKEKKSRNIPQAALLFLLLLCFVFIIPSHATAKDVVTLNSTSKKSGTRILFVGNSKTYTNDIPGIFSKICKSKGKKVSVSTVTVGGATLSEVAKEKKNELKKGKYDYVVIQEHTTNSTKYSKYLKGAQEVVKLVRKNNPKVKIVVRKIWLTTKSSKSTIQKSYRVADKVAKKLKATVSQDGPAFDLCKKKYPNFELLSDTRHPTKKGAYLSACCVYCAIFKKSPVGCTYHGDISKSRAKKLQKIAAEVSF